MALKWFDGFDYTSNSAMLTSRAWWNASEWSIAVGVGRFGGNCLFGGNGGVPGTGGITRVLAAACTEAFFGMAYNTPAGTQFGFTDLTLSNRMQCWLSMDDYGVIRAYQGDYSGEGTTTLIGTSAPNSYIPGVWNYIETHVRIAADTTGLLEARVNGAVVLTVAQPTQNTASANANFGGIRFAAGRGAQVFVDDCYFCDTTGAAPYNTYLGNVRVVCGLPSAAGASTQFTASGSDPNYQSAANINVDDTLYVADATVGDEDLYEVGWTIGGVTVLGVQAIGAYRQDDATQRSGQTMVKSGSTYATTAAVACSSSYAIQTDGPWIVNPATNDPWLPADVMALQIGPKVAA